MEGIQENFLSAEDTTDAAAPPRRFLDRTNNRCFAAVEFSLEWQSDAARHTDIYVSGSLNLWRDYMPPELEAVLINQPVGHTSRLRFQAGQLVTDYAVADCVQAPLERFNRPYRKLGEVVPHAGRFYPRGFIAGVKGITSDDVQVFRLGAVEAGTMTVDLNHPLAGKPIAVSTRILEAWAAVAEHGGRCNDVPDMIAGKGPGMQARWRNRPTDFFSGDGFRRDAGGADAEFYTQARMVDHLDRVALRQVEKLYLRLLPTGGRILDLMSSWKSHLGGGYSSVTGLGMNAEELAANPVLSERHVQDLNQQPLLPFDDGAFDGAVCTVSVEYLVRPFEVFAEIKRVLKPGAPFVLTFSNRWFPPKVIEAWEQAHQFERPGMVLEYFLQGGGWTDLHTFSMVGLPRPVDDKYADRMAYSDPVHAVWGFRDQG